MAGGFLIAGAAVTVFAVTIPSHGPGPSWVVASHQMGPGTVLGPADLTTEDIRLPGPTAAVAYPNAAALIGRSLLVTVRPGELLESTLLSAPGATATLRPVTIAVDPPSLDGLAIGQTVDVLETDDSGTGSTGATGAAGSADATTSPGSAAASTGGVSVVVRGASVLAIARPSSNLADGSDTNDVTIGVPSLTDVEAAVAAAHSGTVTLVVAEPSDGVGLGPPPSHGRRP